LLTLFPCKNFKFYYFTCVTNSDFPNKVSYNRFIELQPRAFHVIAALASSCKGEETGNYFIDATTLAVAHNKRTCQHKVLNIAKIGKSTMGWFFGFKLHLVINQKGEIMNLAITKGNATDISMVTSLLENLTGKTSCGLL
jgi:hypothetical protein